MLQFRFAICLFPCCVAAKNKPPPDNRHRRVVEISTRHGAVLSLDQAVGPRPSTPVTAYRYVTYIRYVVSSELSRRLSLSQLLGCGAGRGDAQADGPQDMLQ